MMSRFPKITETFILYEILAVEQHNVEVEIYPLVREHAAVMHAEASAVVARAHYEPLLSLAILRAHLYFLWRKPGAYLAALATLLWATCGSLRYFCGAIALFPKTVKFARDMAAQRVGHVHAHFASHPAAAAFVVHRLTGIPYSFTAHGSDLHRDRHMLREKVREAAFVVAISEYNRQIILEHCGQEHRDKVGVVHCGVDPNIFAPPEPKHEPAHDDFNVLCIGTLHEVKGQTFLVEACRLLRQRGLKFTCHFVGDGPDEASLEQQVKAAALTEHVKFHGRCTRTQVKALLAQAHVVAAPSVPSRDGRREGIPVVLMEAMAAGVPVVASRLSGIPELVEHNRSGLLVSPGDTQGIADALARLHADRELRLRLALAGREVVTREFNLERNAKRLAEIFAAGKFA